MTMADISDIEKDIVEALRGEPLHQSDSEILRRLMYADPTVSLPPPSRPMPTPILTPISSPPQP